MARVGSGGARSGARTRRRVLAGVGLIWLGVGLPLHADWVWTAETGWYNPATEVHSSPEDLLAEARKAFEAEHYREAAIGFRMLLDTYPESESAATAQVEMLEAQFLGRDYDGALATSEAILARKPDARTVSLVLRRRYEIGAAFVAGARRSFLGIPVSAEGYGIEILDELVERYPYQANADDALYHIANYYMREREYARATVVYERLIRDYPQSEWASIAEYQVGAAALARLKGVEYDFTPVDEAERRFRRYLSRYRGGDKALEAKGGLRRIDLLRAQRLLDIAKFYRQRGKRKAVRSYLQRITRDHPDTPAGREARRMLGQLGSARDD